MKIKNNTIYHLPTRELEQQFLIQAEEQGIRWSSGHNATEKSYWDEHQDYYCISIRNNLALCGDLFFYQTDFDYKEKPIVKWLPEFAKDDMEIHLDDETIKNRDYKTWEEVERKLFTAEQIENSNKKVKKMIKRQRKNLKASVKALEEIARLEEEPRKGHIELAVSILNNHLLFENEKGCPCCREIEEYSVISVQGVEDKDGVYIGINAPLNYCYNCGRRLK